MVLPRLVCTSPASVSPRERLFWPDGIISAGEGRVLPAQAQPGHTVAAPPGGKKAPGRQGLEKRVEVAIILQTLGNPLKLWAWLFFAVTRPPQVAPDQCAAHSRRSANAPSIAQILCLLPLLQP